MSNVSLGVEQGSRFADLALEGISREYPNKLDHVMNGEGDVLAPRQLHPAFYGCFDWHSSVHSHWMLVRLLKVLPGLPKAQDIRAGLATNLTADNLMAEKEYLDQPNRRSFERTYGWAWLLKLAEELYTWGDPQGREWHRNLQPLAAGFVDRYLDFLPRQSYPIRTGTHPNTAFGLTFALDYARTMEHRELEDLVLERSRAYYLADTGSPAHWEPGGNDFLSPSLIEADLMRRVLPASEFQEWLGGFLPGLQRSEPPSLFEPADVADRTDPQIVHLDGLNLSRAWCMRNLASALSPQHPARAILADAAGRHERASLPHVTSGDYMGEHWLASFAVYLLT